MARDGRVAAAILVKVLGEEEQCWGLSWESGPEYVGGENYLRLWLCSIDVNDGRPDYLLGRWPGLKQSRLAEEFEEMIEHNRLNVIKTFAEES